MSYDFRIDVSDSSGNASFEVQGTPTYTADPGTTNPFDAGTFTFDGKVSFQDSDGTYELTRQSGGVHYSNSCGGFDSGTVNYKDTSGNTMAITYTGCNSRQPHVQREHRVLSASEHGPLDASARTRRSAPTLVGGRASLHAALSQADTYRAPLPQAPLPQAPLPQPPVPHAARRPDTIPATRTASRTQSLTPTPR